jgi:hypothetical protein
MVNKYLGLVFKTAKCTGMDDTVAIPLKLIAALWRSFGV